MPSFGGSRRFPLETMPDRDRQLGPAIAGTIGVGKEGEEIGAYNGSAYLHEHLVERYCRILGTSFAALVAYEDRVALNYLLGRADIDASRVASDVLPACVIAGMINSYEELLDRCVAEHTWMFFPPGLSRFGDWPNLAAGLPPTPVLVQYLLDDAQFTQDGMRLSDRIIAERYAREGTAEAYRGEFYPGPHRFDRAMQDSALAWLGNIFDEERLNAHFTMHRYFEAADKATFLAGHDANIRGIATRGELGANRAMIEALPNLEIISVYGVGFDAVDLAAERERGVRVTKTPDVLTKDVAGLAIEMMLAQAQGVIGAETWGRCGDWARKGLYPLRSRVHGKRAGILGLGRIGYEVAKRLAGFDMDIAYTDTGPKDFGRDWTFVADPVELAQRSDFLFVTLSASAETRDIVCHEVIEALGSEGMLINISRASNIDEAVLLDALESRALGSAALDVFEGSPSSTRAS